MKTIAAILKYGVMALTAIAKVQAEVGESKGDPNLQQTKKQLAVSYVLAAAHAGETIANDKVQQIASVVDMQVSLANVLGLFGKPKSITAVVTVPVADQQELPLK